MAHCHRCVTSHCTVSGANALRSNLIFRRRRRQIPPASPQGIPKLKHEVRATNSRTFIKPIMIPATAASSQCQACGALSRNYSRRQLARSAATLSRRLSSRSVLRTMTLSVTSVSLAPSSGFRVVLLWVIWCADRCAGCPMCLARACPSAFSLMRQTSTVRSRLIWSTCLWMI